MLHEPQTTRWFRRASDHQVACCGWLPLFLAEPTLANPDRRHGSEDRLMDAALAGLRCLPLNVMQRCTQTVITWKAPKPSLGDSAVRIRAGRVQDT